MQAFSKETRIKETTLQKRRNLFGLGFTSLIAACGADSANKGAGDDMVPDNGIDTYTPTVDLPDEVLAAADLSGTGVGKSGFTATTGGNITLFTVEVTEAGTTKATLTFEGEGLRANTSAAKIYQLTATEDQFDLVVSSSVMYRSKGGIFIFWNVADIQDETIGGTPPTTTNERLEIKGVAVNDQIGLFAPDFLQIGGAANNYDIVFAGIAVDRVSGSNTRAGGIYILWDVTDYAGTTKSIDLASIADATSGSLAIYGKIALDYIGTYAPQLLELGSADDAYDMVIRSELVDKSGDGDGNNTDEGAIYILWDVTGYHDTEALHKTVILDNSLVDASGAYTNGAAYGLLAIYGAKVADKIGIHAPDFLQIAGAVDENGTPQYDMVIRSFHVDKSDGSGGTLDNSGAIYILWDVADYAGQNKNIDLGNLAEADTAASFGEGATAGSLAIYGAKTSDGIGFSASKFLQIGGKDDNYDMVIRSHWIDKLADQVDTEEGAIYVLWDVADYKNTNQSIVLDNGASSGLLTIYGAYAAGSRATSAMQGLGNDLHDILYNADDELTNIDGDVAGTKDISFRDKDYTYILFGDKVADTGDDDKVDSKTIDLAVVETALTAGTAGFFGYDFDGTSGSAEAVNRVGYRFANNAHTTLADVQGAYTTDTSGALSDVDADLAVWDIA